LKEFFKFRNSRKIVSKSTAIKGKLKSIAKAFERRINTKAFIMRENVDKKF
jgi:hypothetical protein